MKVFVVSDMEGVAGIVRWQQVTGGHAMYEEGRRLYTGEINAAVRGAKAAGATEIVVMDCHGAGEGWTFNSLLPEELDPDCEYVVQNEWTEYVDYLESGVDAALFVGMHAMAGTRDGVLAHTVSGSSWWRLRFNGVEVGETGINAALCGTWGCPVVLVTGDEAACREGRELLGAGLTTAAVKKRPRPVQRAPVPGRPRPRADRGRGEALAGRPLGRRALRPRLAVRDPRRLQHLGSRREVPLSRRASRSPARGRSPLARTTGGRPGGSSSSRRGGYLLPSMALLAARGIAKSFGSRLILDGLDFDVEPGVRMGVIGPNGGGKSTLLRILAGDELADAGDVTQRRGLVVSYLPQQLEGDERDAFATLRAARPDLDELEQELETVEAGIGAAGGDLDRMTRLLRRQEELLQRWTAAGGPGFEPPRTRAPRRGRAGRRRPRASRRASSRAGSGSSSAWRPACCAIPTCCCSTSPRRTSTSRRASGSSS